MKRGKSRGRETSKKVLAIFMVKEDGVLEHGHRSRGGDKW